MAHEWAIVQLDAHPETNQAIAVHWRFGEAYGCVNLAEPQDIDGLTKEAVIVMVKDALGPDYVEHCETHAGPLEQSLIMIESEQLL